MRAALNETTEAPPRFETDDQLHEWLATELELRVPRHAICPNHNAPFDYMRHAYFEPELDVVVWASRGGGKTRLAAAATLLDLLHKPGCSVRILGGSLEQSRRMWEHLLPDVERLAPEAERRHASRRIDLPGGSTAAILAQSQRAVRGLRVQKLRCDEVEMFDPAIWEAAQLVTRSCPDRHGRPIRGAIEAISTCHRPAGLMSQLLDQARKDGTRIIHWCLLDVLERCPPERPCTGCALRDECHGMAKTRCDGFFGIEDAIVMKRRVSRDAWECEMLCRRPSTKQAVFPSFSEALHVREMGRLDAVISLAIDFGFHNPFVCLWIADDGSTCHVLDEYVQPQQTVAQHVMQIAARRHCVVRRICCDPAGSGRNEQTAESNIALLRRCGYTVCYRASRIAEGLEMIRAGLAPACGLASLFISPRCERLIAAMKGYQYAPGGSELPVKDGVHDHLIDALRYFYVNRAGNGPSGGRRY